MFVHCVYFWLKPQTTSDVRERMIADALALKAIPTVRHIWVGRPAGVEREVADNSYDVGLCVVFDDRAGHDLYQDHPLHNAFVARHSAAWARIQVYDFH